MQPYFSTALGTLYHGDCLDLMRDMADASVDLVLTDPPYGVGEAAGKNARRFCSKTRTAKNTRGTDIPTTKFAAKEWDNSPPPPEAFSQIQRVGKHQVIFGGNFFPLPPSPCWLIWDKENAGTGFADCELAWTSFKTAVRMVRYRWNGMLQGRLSPTSLDKERRVHPTQKPVHVMRWILERYSKPSDLIFDPFFWSGTTAIAAEMLGRKWIGIEREADYCTAAVARLQQPSQRLLCTVS